MSPTHTFTLFQHKAYLFLQNWEKKQCFRSQAKCHMPNQHANAPTKQNMHNGCQDLDHAPFCVPLQLKTLTAWPCCAARCFFNIPNPNPVLYSSLTPVLASPTSNNLVPSSPCPFQFRR
jgi:hypothetical protein